MVKVSNNRTLPKQGISNNQSSKFKKFRISSYENPLLFKNLIYVPKFTKNIKNEEKKKAQIKFNSAGGPIFI